ncbi:hypothetical protein KIW84_046189, partial [Lathyrus oleraceus]
RFLLIVNLLFPPQSPTNHPFFLPMIIQAFHASSSSCYFNSHLQSCSTKRFPSKKSLKLNCSTASDGDKNDYLLDAPVSVGDGFSFSGGKYSDGPNPSDEWFKQGKMVKAYSIPGTGEKAKDPIFGLTMGNSSQASGDRFRWFCVESGNADNPSVILVHGFPSQAYSYRKVLPVLSKDYHAVTFDWLGFGFSDKPQPKYGFDYTLDEYVSSLESLIDELGVTKVSLVVQGYFSPVVVKYASNHKEKINNLILINPPLNMPSFHQHCPYSATFS